jgi:hypothetical protein
MQCVQFDKTVEDEPDGPLPAEAILHLETCPDCRLLWSDLDLIRAASREWGAQEPVPPPAMWVALRAQLESEGLIHGPKQVPTHALVGDSVGGKGWLATLLGGSGASAPRLSLAGACCSLLLVASALLGLQLRTYPDSASSNGDLGGVLPKVFPAGDSAPASPLSGLDLHQTLDGDMERVMAALPGRNASLAMSLEENLGIVDHLIAACEKSMREQPDNPAVRQYLYGAYQQKAVLLATAIDRTTLEDR